MARGKDKINENTLKILTNLDISKKFTHLDVLNLLLIDKVKYLDRKFNQ